MPWLSSECGYVSVCVFWSERVWSFALISNGFTSKRLATETRLMTCTHGVHVPEEPDVNAEDLRWQWWCRHRQQVESEEFLFRSLLHTSFLRLLPPPPPLLLFLCPLWTLSSTILYVTEESFKGNSSKHARTRDTFISIHCDHIVSNSRESWNTAAVWSGLVCSFLFENVLRNLVTAFSLFLHPKDTSFSTFGCAEFLE